MYAYYKGLEWEGQRLSTALPANIKNDNCSPVRFSTVLGEEEIETHIMFYAIQANTRVLLDDVVLLEFEANTNDFIYLSRPSMYHIVELPEDFQGHTLTIEMVPTQKIASGILPTVYIGDKASFIYALIRDAAPKIILCVPMMLMSILIFLVGTFLRIQIKHIGKRLCCFGLMIFNICVWILLESRIKQLFFQNYNVANVLLVVSYFLVPGLVLAFFLNYDLFKKVPHIKWLYICSQLQFIFALIVMLSGRSTTSCNFFMQITSSAIVLIVLYVIFENRKSPEQLAEIKTLLVGLVALCIGCVLELVRFFFFSKVQSGGLLLLSLAFFTCYYGLQSVHEFVMSYIVSNKKNTELQIALEANNLKIKVAQMHPHFLYNALSAIQMIVKVSPDYAYQLLYDFTVHLRGTVRCLASDAPIPFSEELKNIKAYLNIEQMRFGDALKVVYDIQCDHFFVAPLVIQPIAENAARHGVFERGEDGGTITIRSYEATECYVIEVIDTGLGFDVKSVLSRNRISDSVGLKNIIFRLENLLNAKVAFESVVGKGTRVIVSLPKGQEPNRKSTHILSRGK